MTTADELWAQVEECRANAVRAFAKHFPPRDQAAVLKCNAARKALVAAAKEHARVLGDQVQMGDRFDTGVVSKADIEFPWSSALWGGAVVEVTKIYTDGLGRRRYSVTRVRKDGELAMTPRINDLDDLKLAFWRRVPRADRQA